MYAACGFLLIVLALPPLSVDIAAYLFFLPLLAGLYRFQSKPGVATLESALFGTALGAYAYLGAYAEGWKLYALGISLCALLFAVCGYLTTRLFARRHKQWVLSCPVIWAAGELLINRVGLPFEFALTLDDSLIPLQLAGLGGPWLVTTYLLFVQTTVFLCARLILAHHWRSALAYGCTAAVAGIITYGFGVYRIDHYDNLQPSHTTVVVAQTSLSPRLLRNSANHGALEIIIEQHRFLEQRIQQSPVHEQPIITWPESAHPGLRLAVANDTLNSKTGATNIVHTYALSHDANLVSETSVLDRHGNLLSRSLKSRPVPFAEADINAGGNLAIHNSIDTTFGSLICYESSFPDLARKLVNKGARWLTIQTNDAFEWPSYMYSTNLALARMRAIENGVSVVRAANGGISAIISPTGSLQSSVPLFNIDVARGKIYITDKPTVYTRYGNLIHSLFILVACALTIVALSKFSHRPSTTQRNAALYRYYIVMSALVVLSVTFVVNAWQYNTMAQLYKDAFEDHRQTTESVKKDSDINHGPGKLPLALTHALRRYGFIQPRQPFPSSPDLLEDWAKSHGLNTLTGSLDDSFTALRFAMTGLIKLAAGDIAVVIGRDGSHFRLYFPERNSSQWIPIKRLRRMQIGSVVWLVPTTLQKESLESVSYFEPFPTVLELTGYEDMREHTVEQYFSAGFHSSDIGHLV